MVNARGLTWSAELQLLLFKTAKAVLLQTHSITYFAQSAEWGNNKRAN
jgi:hypothetical protein